MKRFLEVAVAASAAFLVLPAGHARAQDDTDRRCLQCHGQAHIGELGPAERRSMVGTWLEKDAPAPGGAAPIEPLKGDEPALRPGLHVIPAVFTSGPHAAVRCIQCHEDAAKLPHAAVLQKATCSASCHEAAVKAYDGGSHREAFLRKDPLAPTCASCHGNHDILRISDRKAPQNKLNSLFLCGDCHKQHSATPTNGNPVSRIENYLDSAHARAVTKSGLPMAATCADCHGAHGVRPSKEPASSVNRANIPATCGKCHVGVAEVYALSVHGEKHAKADSKAAVCTDCHTAHQITLASTPGFLLDVINECGKCHDSADANGDRVGTYYESYHRSYHGQVSRLGGVRAARCSDCHGAHDIRPLEDPQSRVSARNRIATCSACHPAANANFVKFDPHADYRDARNYPVLHGVWLYFMIMMSAVFTFFGVHTLMWFLRSMLDRWRHGKPHPHALGPTALRRFTGLNRVNHALVAITFFGLTATGIPLVFSGQRWAQVLANLLGGIEAAGLWHRFFAILLIVNFIAHFVGLGHSFLNRKVPWHVWMFGPNSLVPRWKDVTDCTGMWLWFVGLGKRPRFDRWTYWEKFDYWAEVGGSMIIGGSGLLLWFPELASRILPGWSFNIAMIIHGYEALLAIGFIFTIHFFNAHIRPGTFPVDDVIFTGSVPEHEMKESRPEEYARLVESGEIEAIRVPAPDARRRPLWIIVAVLSVGLGVALLTLIVLGGLELI
ncbi:MAG: hypothetical protein IT436_15380 [Phycisphaerales bacterium]|nr:hypothetical protein [Phycisphaerales bacterium]